MESITSIPNNRGNNNTINNLTSTTDKSLLPLLPNSNSRDLSVGVVHYNMEAFGEN